MSFTFNKFVLKEIITLNFKKSCILFVGLFFLVFVSCQKETFEETHSTTETITTSSPLTSFLGRIAMQKTCQDNIIDHTDCFTIKFPYQITVNGSQIAINSEADYLYVQYNIDAYTTDNDIVYIHFPVVALKSDYSESNLSNQTDFNNLITVCQANTNNFGKINCLTINYPISINIYNSSNQIASTTKIFDNHGFYNFLNNLSANQYISISYPINVINQNGQTVSITSNNQFEDVIKDALSNCPQNPLPTQDFMQTITSGTWKISYYYDSNDLTSNYNGYIFSFNNSNVVTATKLGVTKTGAWESSLNSGIREFELNFSTSPLHELEEDWRLFEFNDTHLRFRDVKSGNNETDYLYFEKI